MKKQKEPIRLLLTWIRGAVGKEFVIKHYKYGVVKTKFPDMTKIIASVQQRKCRDLFKEAVAYAKMVYADPVKKKEWHKKSRKKHRVFNYIIKEFMLEVKRSALNRQQATARIIRRCFHPLQKMESENCLEPAPRLQKFRKYLPKIPETSKTFETLSSTSHEIRNLPAADRYKSRAVQ